MINIADFKKLDLRVAVILKAEPVENSTKLLRLALDLGKEKRQIVSGIAKSYSPEELIGKQIIIIANLESKQIMGLESHGMLLAVDQEQKTVLLSLDGQVEPGSKIC